MTRSGLVISSIGGVTTVVLRDFSILDALAVEHIGSELYRLVDEEAHRKLLLDFTQVKFLSSSMIGVLLALQKKSDAIGGKVLICGLQARLLEIIKSTQLDKVLEVAQNEEEALSRLGAVR